LELVSGGFLVSVKYASLDTLQNASLSPPATTADIQYGREMPSVILPASGMKACEALSTSAGGTNSDDEYVRLSVASWLTNPYVGGLEKSLPTNDTLSSGILRFSSIGAKTQSSAIAAATANTSYDTNYTLILQWNSEHAWNNTADYPGIASFLADGSATEAPCQLQSISATSVAFTCFNLLDLCPQQYSTANSTTNRRLEMGGDELQGSDDAGVYHRLPTIYPDHPHYAYWSSVKLKQHNQRRLDFDYGGEGDDDEAGSVSVSDFGALITGVSVELTDTLSASPTIFTTSQGMSVLIGLGVVLVLFVIRLRFFMQWDRRDRQRKYTVPQGKKEALVKLTAWSDVSMPVPSDRVVYSDDDSDDTKKPLKELKLPRLQGKVAFQAASNAEMSLLDQLHGEVSEEEKEEEMFEAEEEDFFDEEEEEEEEEEGDKFNADFASFGYNNHKDPKVDVWYEQADDQGNDEGEDMDKKRSTDCTHRIS
jgi:hypothetical protein